jgi:hypothetical protein
VNVEALLEDMVPLGTMVSFWIVARMPRWEVEVMRVPRADLSSWEACGWLAGGFWVELGFRKRTRDPRLHLCWLLAKTQHCGG